MKLEQAYQILDAIIVDEYGCHILPDRKPYADRYPEITIDGKQRRVNRLVLERKLGRPIKPGYFACHTCDYRPCVNPNHIYEGTRADNARDMVERNPEWVQTGANLTKLNQSPEARERSRAMMNKLNENRRKKL
jgi:hypothetical protein